MTDTRLFYRRRLPHYQPPEATLFVTYRLFGSLPQYVIQQLLDEQEHMNQLLDQIKDPAAQAEAADLEARRLFGKWDRALDFAETGTLWLKNPDAAQIVADSLHYLDGRVCLLDAFTIMSNHVHVVLEPSQKEDETYNALEDIMKSTKGYTAYEINNLLERKGQFWQPESYDHVVRDGGEHERIIRYVLNNSVKAGLIDHWQGWQWSYCSERHLEWMT